jgi:GH25 family lysozyme M1 (1,4-beta-N-acetylmuramidase)
VFENEVNAMAVKSKKKTKTKTKSQPKPKKLIIALAFALIIAIVISVITINSQHKINQSLYKFSSPTSQGIDLSEHNGEVDWSIIAENYDFAFIRVGYRGYGNGEIYEDKYAKENLKNAQKAGIPFGVYFYSQAVTEKEAEKEADFVMDIVKHYDLSLPIVIDFEYPTDEDGYNTGRLIDAQLSKSDTTNIINAFCKKVEKKGYISGLYASSSLMYYDINLNALSDDTVIWVADYNSSVSYDIDYDVWQYSRTGTSDGVSSKYVDLNYWYSEE